MLCCFQKTQRLRAAFGYLHFVVLSSPNALLMASMEEKVNTKHLIATSLLCFLLLHFLCPNANRCMVSAYLKMGERWEEWVNNKTTSVAANTLSWMWVWFTAFDGLQAACLTVARTWSQGSQQHAVGAGDVSSPVLQGQLSFPDREDIFSVVVVFSCTSILSSLCFGSQVFELVGNHVLTRIIPDLRQEGQMGQPGSGLIHSLLFLGHFSEELKTPWIRAPLAWKSDPTWGVSQLRSLPRSIHLDAWFWFLNILWLAWTKTPDPSPHPGMLWGACRCHSSRVHTLCSQSFGDLVILLFSWTSRWIPQSSLSWAAIMLDVLRAHWIWQNMVLFWMLAHLPITSSLVPYLGCWCHHEQVSQVSVVLAHFSSSGCIPAASDTRGTPSVHP